MNQLPGSMPCDVCGLDVRRQPMPYQIGNGQILCGEHRGPPRKRPVFSHVFWSDGSATEVRH